MIGMERAEWRTRKASPHPLCRAVAPSRSLLLMKAIGTVSLITAAPAACLLAVDSFLEIVSVAGAPLGSVITAVVVCCVFANRMRLHSTVKPATERLPHDPILDLTPGETFQNAIRVWKHAFSWRRDLAKRPAARRPVLRARARRIVRRTLAKASCDGCSNDSDGDGGGDGHLSPRTLLTGCTWAFVFNISWCTE